MCSGFKSHMSTCTIEARNCFSFFFFILLFSRVRTAEWQTKIFGLSVCSKVDSSIEASHQIRKEGGQKKTRGKTPYGKIKTTSLTNSWFFAASSVMKHIEIKKQQLLSCKKSGAGFCVSKSLWNRKHSAQKTLEYNRKKLHTGKHEVQVGPFKHVHSGKTSRPREAQTQSCVNYSSSFFFN